MHTFAYLDAPRYAQSHPTPRSAARSDHHPIGPARLPARTDTAGFPGVAAGRHGQSAAQDDGATEVPSAPDVSVAMSIAVTMRVSEPCQGREKCIARCVLLQNPSHRIATFALQSIAQGRRLIGMRIVVGRTLGLVARFLGMAMAFGDAQHFPQDRVWTPEVARAWRIRRARLSNPFVLRNA